MSVPYWLIKSQNHLHYDFIIIGGGIAGVSTAYWIKKNHPKATVLILEKNTLGSGASGRNAGFISSGSIALFEKKVEHFGLKTALEIRNFYKENHNLIKQEIIPTSLDKSSVDYKLCGSITLSSGNNELVETLNANGFDIDLVTAMDLKSQGLSNFSASFLDKEDASVHSHKLVNKIFSKSEASLLENCEVYKVDGTKIFTNQGQLNCDTVIYAMNGYSNTLLDAKVSPIRAQILVAKMDHHLITNFYSPTHLCYFRPLDYNHVLIGGFRKLEEDTEVGYSDHFVTPKIQNAFFEFLKSNVVHKNIEIENQWAGIMGFTHDDMPLIGEIAKNTYFIGGFNGHGMGQSFHCAKVLSDLILNQIEVPTFLKIGR